MQFDFIKHMVEYYKKEGISDEELDKLAKKLAELMWKDNELRELVFRIGDLMMQVFKLFEEIQTLYERIYQRLKELGEEELAKIIRINMEVTDQSLTFFSE